jgi:hypothetical protein
LDAGFFKARVQKFPPASLTLETKTWAQRFKTFFS